MDAGSSVKNTRYQPQKIDAAKNWLVSYCCCRRLIFGVLVFQRTDQLLINALMDCFMKGVMNRLIHGR